MRLHALDLAPVSGGEYGEGQGSGSAVVVVGCDGSPASEDAVRYAVKRAGDHGSVIAVHAAGRRQEGEDVLRSAKQLIPDGTRFEPVLGEGSAPDVLVRVAQESRADELVVGAHSAAPGTDRLGNVPQALLAHADRPVVVVPASKAGP